MKDLLTDEHWVQALLWKLDIARFDSTQVTSQDIVIAYLENKQLNVILFAISLSEKGLEAVK